MAAGRIPAPGTQYGPCARECEHRDCAANREIAQAVCYHCEEPIGYDTGFYNGERSGLYVHSVCEEEAIERTHQLLKKHREERSWRLMREHGEGVQAFRQLCMSWVLSPSKLSVLAHEETMLFLLKEDLVSIGPTEYRLQGLKLVQDNRVPPWFLRVGVELEANLHVGSFSVDVHLEPVPHDPQGGTCDAVATCSSCGVVSPEHAEGTEAFDAYRSAAWYAQQHRADTGHFVSVEGYIHYARKVEP